MVFTYRCISTLLLRDNLLYFFSITCILVFNNLMVVGVTHIPWFSYGPFHAAVGILTTRMILNVRKAANRTSFVSGAERDILVITRDLPFPDTIPDTIASWIVAQNSQFPSSFDCLDHDEFPLGSRGVTNHVHV
ncbi:hypothetical protein DFH05DRAFT_502435 [Lentinula detonsa]|uniref:Uncharacterized protein n=1 Tax=Lentinula detonsa TaxID=2804962 RepID=A0A9W8TT61_9AGAR|nr:hypothetical protein DFH05DRAFT_502435 [Lentinula detonsa]